MTDYPDAVREYERWARLHRTTYQQKNGIAKADAAIAALKKWGFGYEAMCTDLTETLDDERIARKSAEAEVARLVGALARMDVRVGQAEAEAEAP